MQLNASYSTSSPPPGIALFYLQLLCSSLFFFLFYFASPPAVVLFFFPACCSLGSDPGSPKKCRARFGLNQQTDWCGPCRWVPEHPLTLCTIITLNLSISPSSKHASLHLLLLSHSDIPHQHVQRKVHIFCL